MNAIAKETLRSMMIHEPGSSSISMVHFHPASGRRMILPFTLNSQTF